MSERFTNSKIFLFSLISFLVGVAVASIWEVTEMFLLAGFVVLVLVIFSVYTNRKNRRNWCLFFCLLFFLLGIFRTNQEIEKMNLDRGEGIFSGEVMIAKDPAKKQEYQQLVVKEVGDSKKERFLIFAPLHPEFEYGEILQISCSLTLPENRHEKFNYQRFLAKDGIYQICRSSKIQKINRNEGNFLLVKVLKLRYLLEEKVSALFSEPESGYLAGLLLGGDDRLPEDVAESFRRTGTTHTVAVSGYNITILASALMFLGLSFGLFRKYAFWFAVMGIILFVVMIGAPSSAVRATIMGGLILLAGNLGRLASSVRLIIFASFLMVCCSPFVLLYDVGFQLSVLATLGIVLIYGPLSEKFEIEHDFLELKSILLVTVSAQLGVLGILIYTFESFSLISLLANLIILPLIPFLMFGGFFVVALSFVLLFIAKVIALPIWLGLHFEIWAVGLLAKFDWAIVEIKNVGLWWLILYYLFFAGLVIKLRKEDQEKAQDERG